MIRDKYKVSELALASMIRVRQHDYGATVSYVIHGSKSQASKIKVGFGGLFSLETIGSNRFKNKKMVVLQNKLNNNHVDDILLTIREIMTDLSNLKGMDSVVFEIILCGEYEDGSTMQDSIRIKG